MRGVGCERSNREDDPELHCAAGWAGVTVSVETVRSEEVAALSIDQV